jgi:hypothetical protein
VQVLYGVTLGAPLPGLRCCKIPAQAMEVLDGLSSLADRALVERRVVTFDVRPDDVG